MSLNIAEKFLLLTLNQDKPGYMIIDQSRDTGLIGAILLDLTQEGCIDITGDGVRTVSMKARLPEAHREILHRISKSNRQKKVKSWISNFGIRSGKYRKMVVHDLKNKGIARLEEKRFLFIPYQRVHLGNKRLREDLIREVRQVLLKKSSPTEEIGILCGLIDGCRMYRVLSDDKKERNRFKALLQEIPHEQVVSGKVAQVIREMQAAVAIAVFVSTSAATR